MYVVGKTLDDLLLRVFRTILRSGHIVAPSRGECREKVGVLLKLDNPRARLSRTERRGELLFSCLGELFWYLAGSKDLAHIKYYIKKYEDESDDGTTIHGAYGPRLLKMRGSIDQLDNVTELLRQKPDSRRAVIQLFDAGDLVGSHKEIPCTCSLQFVLRRGRLLMQASMRSNDAYKGLPHDVFAFTMLQELVARRLGVEPGEYRHAVGSLHLYKTDYKAAQQLVEEGWQSTASPMPSMPRGDQWPAVETVLKVEDALRRGNKARDIEDKLDPYWADIVRLLRIFRAYKDRDNNGVRRLRGKMSSKLFDKFIGKKQEKVRRMIEKPKPTQQNLFDVPQRPESGRRRR